MIEIGPLRIQWYGFLLTLAIFVGFALAKRRLRAWGFDADRFETAAFWAVVFGVVGARLGYVLTSPGPFLQNPVEILYVWHGGLSFHGAVLGGGLAFWYLHRFRGHPLWPYLDAATPGVALGIIAGRIGNLMNGSDTVGRLTSLPIGFTWPEWAVGFPGVCPGIDDISQVYWCQELVRGPVHLTQVYGALVGLILLPLAYYWLKKKPFYGYAFWNFILWYSLLRSVLEEPFRLNPLWLPVYRNDELGLGLFTATQVVSLPLILLSLYMLRRLGRASR
ncbi:prolipoprotein diacylglyceryl transferase [Thermus thermamylovorans]|uniref:Phosphatidylglycerol--prolipoprotein diacylglyceryl transferase n=1 Tax=Thermus thermamylovorans TaxID=2509362 RepID=A0A4Q9B8R2_9DEIN|nr:prolipoprotein diacylglyceryl transferase [Thermus thermamylovorans]TBH21278.1 prolipoprotein diacylglyceryl transferase [Thermus thermamylovorans]